MSKQRFKNVKIDTEVVRKAKVVAAAKNITLSKYITDMIRSQVENDLAVVAQGLAEPAAIDSPVLKVDRQQRPG
jgi:hypothetical protein